MIIGNDLYCVGGYGSLNIEKITLDKVQTDSWQIIETKDISLLSSYIHAYMTAPISENEYIIVGGCHGVGGLQSFD